ncbi:16S rRNA (cytidine(1402)-2'-O)-methyltransferase [Collinsella tanakaei]|jgi:16S rRNA (cytidine1402-2'-O)-methyltransferase|uniref:Ribosomal RNA small subunit methyltransferase I n=1 Tax=Collinsella tanakaei TaxID=626935 RepID=A0A3E4QWA5_9ACTN|nr:16S rRNA (cytidine(1402)-2'-O)-methyltransferase [Collinsella tanakaei]RGL11198.1 16S rRNA (cytidine(1402)-2'-O)-methyltransferase [Collinsella tanakaei]
MAACSSTSGRLIIVGTPIGNLGDLTPRVAQAFEAADAICCEDTRVTSKLLAHLGISRPLVRCDENVIASRSPELIGRILAGDVIAFASDAGMPSVSDPGQVLVDAAREAGVDVEVIPGPSACVTALVASGISCEHFYFEGFLPRKHGERVRRLSQLAAIPGALLFYESPHRVAASLEALAEVFPARQVALCRELTKLHEEVLRAQAPYLLEQVRERGELKGEMVLVVAPPSEEELAAFASMMPGAAVGAAGAVDVDEALQKDIQDALAQGEPASAIAKRLSQRYSLKKRAVYERVLAAQGQ